MITPEGSLGAGLRLRMALLGPVGALLSLEFDDYTSAFLSHKTA
jgi:hypothetical protein